MGSHFNQLPLFAVLGEEGGSSWDGLGRGFVWGLGFRVWGLGFRVWGLNPPKPHREMELLCRPIATRLAVSRNLRNPQPEALNPKP